MIDTKSVVCIIRYYKPMRIPHLSITGHLFFSLKKTSPKSIGRSKPDKKLIIERIYWFTVGKEWAIRPLINICGKYDSKKVA